MAKRFVHMDSRRLEQSLGARSEPRWGLRGTRTVEFGVRSFTTWLEIAADFAVPLVSLVPRSQFSFWLEAWSTKQEALKQDTNLSECEPSARLRS